MINQSQTFGTMQSREQNWQHFLTDTLDLFWQKHAFEWVYEVSDELRIHYALVESAKSEKLVILLPGRVESYLKYKELAFDFYQAGYSVLMLDHRGQGRSSRELTDQEKGYISHFNAYADDLHAICNEVRVFGKYESIFCLGHSMGAAIGLNYLYRYQPKINAFAMSAPMLGIETGVLNQPAAIWVARLFCTATQFNRESPYFIGQHRYERKQYNNNELCHSRCRFEYGQDVLESEELRLGGVTIHWLYQSLLQSQYLLSDVSALNAPSLVLQAGQESIVCNATQTNWFTAAKQCGKNVELMKLEKARHEILMESDEIRSEALERILSFFDDYL